ncbi:transposase [Phytohabitans flavus]|uniref:transposase n=1 Tax=Phytohabitans flavus TaxID=1076124 RepID=UPI001564E899
MLDAVARLDTAGFAARARLGGAGRAGYDPDMLLALLIWAYAGGVTSSRQVERRCREDVAFMVISGLARPDHATIARFRQQHDEAFVDLFTKVLALCGRAGMGGLGHVAVDGTKIAANASMQAMTDEDGLRRIACRLVEQAAADDAVEDELFGDARGDELPEALQDPARRRALLDELIERAETDPNRDRGGKRRRAVDKADRALALADELAAVRDTTRRAARQRLQDELDAARHSAAHIRAAVQQKADERATQHAAAAAEGRRLPGAKPVPVDEHSHVRRAQTRVEAVEAELAAFEATPHTGKTNSGKKNNNPVRCLTDPDCRLMPTRTGFIAGLNTQLAVAADYLILAVEVVQDTGDVNQLEPMHDKIDDAVQTLRDATANPDLAVGTTLFDAGYNSHDNLTAPGPDRLIAQGKTHQPTGPTPPTQPPHPNATAREHMAWRLSTPEGKTLYRKRGATVEPVNAHLKDRRGLRRFSRRGLTAAKAEAHLAAAVTNLLRLATTHGPTALTTA